MLDVLARLLLSAGILYGATGLPASSPSSAARIADAGPASRAILG